MLMHGHFVNNQNNDYFYHVCSNSFLVQYSGLRIFLKVLYIFKVQLEICIKRFKFPVILDEVQRVPDLLSWIQVYVDEGVPNRSYILTGCHQLRLQNVISQLLAGRIGQVVNLNNLSNDIGVSNTTLNHWLSILEASYIIFRLPPYYNNFGKRLIKSPKLYFTEPGLAAWLLGIESPDQIMRDPLHGNLFTMD